MPLLIICGLLASQSGSPPLGTAQPANWTRMTWLWAF
jgi:hypothetical protein